VLKSGNSFEENIKTLFGEIELAIQWKRPSILLAICKSKLSQAKAENALERSAQKLGQGIERIIVNEQRADVAQAILEKGSADRSIFFVSNLDQGGGDDGKNAYRILNLYRELFVERGVRCVFWLTLSEASNLPKFAPDFWAFRHRVIEFASPHGSTEKSLPAGVLIWHVQDSNDSPQSLRNKIQSREELLSQLPNRTESVAARLEILYTLGYLYWMLGENDKASQSLTTGTLLAKTDDLSQIESWLLNGLAILSYEKKEYQAASAIYAEILQRESKDGFLWMNQAIILNALGKNSEAVVQGHRALRLISTDARLWNTMGHLFVWIGKPDEAISFFKRAVELASNIWVYHIALAVCDGLLGLSDEAREEIVLARKTSEDQDLYLGICQEAILGNPETAQSLLRSAIIEGPISKFSVQRDPIWREILDVSLMEISLD
jgi:tetratricopeptide (TPR) repeat protein